MPFLMNAWYVVAWPHEVVADKLFARTVCNEALVLWRNADGSIAALEDRCCHREMPLAAGALEGGTIRCPYHGLRFGPDGRCVEIPGQDRFAPFVVTVAPNGVVSFKNGDTDKHSVTSLPGADVKFDLVIQAGETQTLALPAGTYRYYCTFHAKYNATTQQVAALPDANFPDQPMEGVIVAE